MISYVRQYIDSRVKATSQTLKPWQDAFNSENIPHSTIDTWYFVNYEMGSDGPSDANWTQENLTAQVELFKRGGNNPQKALDELMDLAHGLKLRLINRAHFINQIERVEVDGIRPTPIPSNDDIIKVTLSLRFTLMNNLIWE